MRAFLRTILFGLLVVAYAGANAVAQPENDTAHASEPDAEASESSRVISHLKNVVVTGMPGDTALEVAIWAEAVIETLGERVRSPVPVGYRYPLVIREEQREEEPQGFVITSQYISDGRHLRQEMTWVNGERIPGDDLLEGLVHLLMNRWIYQRQGREALNRALETFPHWFSYGIAQNLNPGSVHENIRIIQAEERRGVYRPAASVVDWKILPPGRWPEKVHAGLVLGWLADVTDPEQLVSTAAETIAEGRPLDHAFLLRMTGARDLREFNAMWDLWVARRSRQIVPDRTAAEITALSRILEMRAEDLGVMHPDIPRDGRVPPDLLIDERDMDWARGVCSLTVWKLRVASVGKMQEIQEALEPWFAFFSLMLDPPKMVRKKRNKHYVDVPVPPTRRELEKAWGRAAKRWRRLEKTREQQKAFLDAYEQPSAAGTNEVSEWLDRWQSESR